MLPGTEAALESLAVTVTFEAELSLQLEICTGFAAALHEAAGAEKRQSSKNARSRQYLGRSG